MRARQVGVGGGCPPSGLPAGGWDACGGSRLVRHASWLYVYGEVKEYVNTLNKLKFYVFLRVLLTCTLAFYVFTFTLCVYNAISL